MTGTRMFYEEIAAGIWFVVFSLRGGNVTVTRIALR